MSDHQVQCIAITFDDGSVGIMQFVLDPRLPEHAVLPGWDPETGQREATDVAIQYEIDRSAWGERTPKSWRLIDAADVPTDRTFRNAWNDTGTIEVHMGKARDIHRQKLRDLRAPMLDRLDIAYMHADELDDTEAKVAIASVKQKLRDITKHPAIDAAQTPEELKAATMDTLKV